MALFQTTLFVLQSTRVNGMYKCKYILLLNNLNKEFLYKSHTLIITKSSLLRVWWYLGDNDGNTGITHNLCKAILTTNLAACLCVRKILPISALTLLFRLQTSRKFCSHSKIPIRCLWTAFCVPLSFIFYEKQ